MAPDGSTGEAIASFSGLTGGYDSGGRILSPEGVAIDESGMLYIADSSSNAILRVDPVSGKTYRLATNSSTNGDLNIPVDITIDERGFLYYVNGLSNEIFKMHPDTGKTKFIASGNTTEGIIDSLVSIAINSNDTIFTTNVSSDSGNSGVVKLQKTTNDDALFAFAEMMRANLFTHDDTFPDSEHIRVMSALNNILLKIDANASIANTFNNTEIFGDIESVRNDFVAHAGLADVFSHLDVSHLLLDAFKMANDSVPLYIDELDAVIGKAKFYLENYNFSGEGVSPHDDLLTTIDGILSNIVTVKGNIRDLETARSVKNSLDDALTGFVNHVSPGNNPFKFLQPFTNNDAVQMMADNGVGGAFIPSLAINTENVIDNGTLTVGISRDGSLIEPNLTNNNGGVGLIMDGFTNNGNEGGDVLATGTPSEGYGVSYFSGGNNFVAKVGSGNDADSSTHGTTIYTKHNETRMETYTSNVGLGRSSSSYVQTDPSLVGNLSITHKFKLIPSPYEAPEGYSREKIMSVQVTATNTGNDQILGLQYRRLADFDNGSPDVATDSMFLANGSTGIVSGDATLNQMRAQIPSRPNSFDPTIVDIDGIGTGTGDFNALIQFHLDTLAPGETKTFEFFYAGDDSSTDLANTIDEAVNDARYVSSTSNTVDPYQTFALGTGSSINSFDSAYVGSTEADHFGILGDTVSLMLRNLALITYAAKTVVSEDSLGVELMDNPKDITIDNNGDLIVVDESSEKVLRLHEETLDDLITPSGVWTTTVITDRPTSGNLIEDPNGVAVAANGDIFITDDGTGIDAILKVDPSDGSTSVIASRSTEGSSIIRNPSGIAIASNGDLIVTDESSEKILRLSETTPGVWTTTVITDLATSGNLLEDPNGVAIASNGDIIITEDSVDGVMKVDPSNGSTSVITSQSTEGTLIFDNPEGLTIDSNGLLIVVNNNDDGAPVGIDSVLKVDPVTGDTRIIATETSTGGKINEPKGVVVGEDGSIFIADTGSDSIVELEETTSTDFLLAFARKIRGDMETHDDEHTDVNDETVQADHDDFLADIDSVITDIVTNIGDPNNVDKTVISGKLKGAWEGLVTHADMQEPAQHAAIAHTLLDSKRLADDQVRLNLASIEEGITLAKAFMEDHINDFGDTTVHRDIDSQIDSALGKVSILKNNIYDTSAAASIKSEVQEAFCDVIDHTIRSDTMEGANPFHFCHGNMDQ
ncbi:MAG: hypothetical protein HON76_18670 [Candidatus Scalindua sp.]|nr:hypothetical protein [Candidatus Scalindua sp.]MBT5307053.1 hypothetical protein [Candidatus Scalindua sp.]MBT6052327.1 hypothetical protein [Candidatus Scalindua sp.]MBT6564544.1 hypothetical protein [Candidatus Scalindua sp.]MBT7211556.1 hypothetical protein [Candidatus Scalindua sp.]